MFPGILNHIFCGVSCKYVLSCSSQQSVECFFDSVVDIFPPGFIEDDVTSVIGETLNPVCIFGDGVIFNTPSHFTRADVIS